MQSRVPSSDDISRDFFISYTGVDEPWAEWIAWQFEESGYSTVLQAWDFEAGAHFVTEMHRSTQIAQRTIAVLSRAYVESSYAEAEWQEAWRTDPAGTDRRLLVFRVEDCRRPGLLGQLISVDLFGVGEEAARSRLLEAVRRGRRKPILPPGFPAQEPPTNEPEFPGRLVEINLGEAVSAGGPMTPDNPWAVAFAFWHAALNNDYMRLDNLITPESRGQWDLADIRQRTATSGIASGVFRPIYDVAHIRIMTNVQNQDSALKLVGGSMPTGARIVSLVYRPELGGWRVHGFGAPLEPDELPRTWTN
jgi:hypothetical protein